MSAPPTRILPHASSAPDTAAGGCGTTRNGARATHLSHTHTHQHRVQPNRHTQGPYVPPRAVDLGISMPSSFTYVIHLAESMPSSFTRHVDHTRCMPTREHMRNDNGSNVLTNLECMVGALVLIFVLLASILLVALLGR
jgi:hypothetical protein